MKKYLFRIALIAVLAMHFGCSQRVNNEVVINGKFIGDIPERTGYTIPVNGKCFTGFRDIISLDSTGVFNIVVETDQPALFSFWYMNAPPLVIEPGGQYDLIMEFDPAKGLSMDGELSELQQFYSALPHENPMLCMYSFGEDITEYHVIRQNFHDALEEELAGISQLFEDGVITNDIKDLLVADRQLYYMTAQSVLASANHLQARRDNQEHLLDEIFDIWAEASRGADLEGPYGMSSLSSWDFLQLHLWYEIYTHHDYDDYLAWRAEKRDNHRTHAHNIELAREYLSGDALEFYMAGTFFHQHGRRQYDDDLMGVFEQFRGDFPESNYLPFVEKTLEEMLERQEELTS